MDQFWPDQTDVEVSMRVASQWGDEQRVAQWDGVGRGHDGTGDMRNLNARRFAFGLNRAHLDVERL